MLSSIEVRLNWEEIEVRFLHEVLSWRYVMVGPICWREETCFSFFHPLSPPTHNNCRCFYDPPLSVGDRVKPSDLGRQTIKCLSDGTRRGVIKGVSKDNEVIYILFTGCKSKQPYHRSFWQRET